MSSQLLSGADATSPRATMSLRDPDFFVSRRGAEAERQSASEGAGG